ncbi:MAG: hypothetical protein ACI8RZ_000306 [Myxococcota bacterium]|jgi:hypothetical protein
MAQCSSTLSIPQFVSDPLRWRYPVGMLFLLACQPTPNPEPADPVDTSPSTDTALSTDEDRDGDGWSEIIGDCDDDNPDAWPGADEVCDGADNDCDGSIDEGVTLTVYTDEDGDGYGADGSDTGACEASLGLVTVDGDCDDADSTIHPDASEVSDNTVDEDCDGRIGESGGVTVTFEGCNDTESRFVQENVNDNRLRILSVLEPLSGNTIAVHVDVDEPVILVLTGDAEREWVVTEADAGDVKEIIVSNDEAVTVSAPKDATVTIYSEAVDDNRLSPPVDHWDDPDARELLIEIENSVQQRLDSFHSCHTADSVTITDGAPLQPTTGYPECDIEPVKEPLTAPDTTVVSALTDCTAVVSESAYCLTTATTDVLAIGLDTGTACTVYDGEADLSAQSITWHGEHLYLCSGSHRIFTRLDLTTGETDKAYTYCDGVTTWSDGLLLFPHDDEPFFDSWQGYAFDDFGSAQCVGPDDRLYEAPVETRFTAHKDLLYAVWGTGDSFQRYNLPDVEFIDAPTLEGFEGLLYGLSMLDDDRLVINTSSDGALRIHQSVTGALIQTVPVSQASTGLVCVVN